jgi:drug/metabolite transporter (DMT)-like permease
MIPVIVDVASGQALSGLAVFAVVLILVAVVLVGFVPGEKVTLPSLPALVYSLGAGLGFAGIFVFLDATSKDSGLGPLVVMRAVGLSLLILGLSYLAIKNKVRFIEKSAFEIKTLTLILVAGAGDVLGNVAFLIATREGALAIAAVLTSLYPVGTILLAWVILKERIAASQTFGIVLAMTACGLLAIG